MGGAERVGRRITSEVRWDHSHLIPLSAHQASKSSPTFFPPQNPSHQLPPSEPNTVCLPKKKMFICYLYVCAVDVYYYFHVCYIKFYFFRSFSLKLAYFAAPNWFGFNFPIIFNNQRCLENSNMISFWLTSLVTSCSHVLYFLFSSLL